MDTFGEQIYFPAAFRLFFWSIDRVLYKPPL
jgi:hypothetical protein